MVIGARGVRCGSIVCFLLSLTRRHLSRAILFVHVCWILCTLQLFQGLSAFVPSQFLAVRNSGVHTSSCMLFVLEEREGLKGTPGIDCLDGAGNDVRSLRTTKLSL